MESVSVLTLLGLIVFSQSLKFQVPREKLINPRHLTEITKFPHTVMVILYNEMFKEMNLCSGSIISSRWVLSAAHPLKRIKETSSIKIRYGIDDVAQDGHIVSVESYVIHENYKIHHYEDIALLKTAREMVFSDSVKPVNLPLSNETAESFSKLHLCAWGTYIEGYFYELTHKLAAIELDIRTGSECDLPGWVTEPESFTFCARPPEGSNGFGSACYGDSGGSGVIKRADGSWVTIGVVKSGLDCRRHTDFVRVSVYTQWIKKMVN